MKKYTIILLTLLAVAPSISSAWWLEFVAPFVAPVINNLSIPASIDFRNETKDSIYVVMDSNRECHTIAPKSEVPFGKANLGDAPTFRVFDKKGSAARYGRRVNPIGIHGSLGWDGKTF